jgi:transposase
VERYRTAVADGSARPQAEEQPADHQRHVLRAARRLAVARSSRKVRGPYTTVYNRLNRWRKAGIWDRLMNAIVKAHGGKVQMIDSSIVRVHQT